jgi:hypothetical protein
MVRCHLLWDLAGWGGSDAVGRGQKAGEGLDDLSRTLPTCARYHRMSSLENHLLLLTLRPSLAVSLSGWPRKF